MRTCSCHQRNSGGEEWAATATIHAEEAPDWPSNSSRIFRGQHAQNTFLSGTHQPQLRLWLLQTANLGRFSVTALKEQSSTQEHVDTTRSCSCSNLLVYLSLTDVADQEV